MKMFIGLRTYIRNLLLNLRLTNLIREPKFIYI